MKRRRRQPTPGEFVDPLSNYEAPDYADDFEQALCEETVDAIDFKPFLKVDESASVLDAMKVMAAENNACVVVVDSDDKPVGIFSERDVVQSVGDDAAELAKVPITDAMTRDPYTVYRTDSPAQVLNLMGSGGFRHVPVVNADGKLLGLIGTRRILRWLSGYFADVASA